MFGAFAEAVRATTQPCTLLLVAPVLAVVITTRCRWQSLAAALVGAVIGGWVFAANSLVLDGGALRISAAVVLVVLVLLVVEPRLAPSIGRAVESHVQMAAVAGVTFVATLWWRPCVGIELGRILTGSRSGLIGELAGMAAYMLGAMTPIAFVVLLARVLAPRDHVLTAASWIGATVGIVVAGALVIGRHDDVVVALTRLTTG